MKPNALILENIKQKVTQARRSQAAQQKQRQG